MRRPPGVLKKKKEIKIEIFYLPSYIVDVQVKTQQGLKVQSLCIDAVLGSFAFFELADVTTSPPEKFSVCPFFLSETDIQARAIEEYRRHLLHVGLKMRYKFQIDHVLSCRPIYYPFWIGYFQRQGSVDFDVIDAVGGEHQGAAMRPVFMKALLNEGSAGSRG
ncbi:hypothetical protein JXA02_04575 [candidate division KSB1 bacterium]|nr:hypothetical protein [candidate division KSB1 bacterium]RQW08778.1 MAG: hypothetical protein EH222_05195 [candidate division KSB1 bacterium]